MSGSPLHFVADDESYQQTQVVWQKKKKKKKLMVLRVMATLSLWETGNWELDRPSLSLDDLGTSPSRDFVPSQSVASHAGQLFLTFEASVHLS